MVKKFLECIYKYECDEYLFIFYDFLKSYIDLKLLFEFVFKFGFCI